MHTAGTVKIIPQDGPAKPPPLAAGALYHHRQAHRGPAQGINYTRPRLTKPSDCGNDCSTNMSGCQGKQYVLYDAMGGTCQGMAAVLPCRPWCRIALGRHKGSEEPRISLACIMCSSTSYCSHISRLPCSSGSIWG